MTTAHYFQPFVVTLRPFVVSLSNHELIFALRQAQGERVVTRAPSTLLRAGFDNLRANGLCRIRLSA